MLEETLQVALHALWSGEMRQRGRLQLAATVHAGRLLNSPQSLTRPHPPILIGGGGERKTLRLVAQYADATNVFGGPVQIAHKYEVLRGHCEAIGRPFDEIERIEPPGREHPPRRAATGTETPAQIVERFGELSDAGAQHVIFSLKNVHDIARLELIGRDVIPQVRDL